MQGKDGRDGELIDLKVEPLQRYRRIGASERSEERRRRSDGLREDEAANGRAAADADASGLCY